MAAISQSLSKAGKSTTAIAQQIRENAKQELDKTLEGVAAQAGLPSAEKQANTEQPPMPQVLQEIRDTGPANINIDDIKRGEGMRIKALEEELMMMVKRREQAEQAHNEQVEAQLQSQSAPAVENVAPQGKIRKAMGQAAGKAKSAVQNILQGKKQQESKQGSGKG